MVLVPAAAMQAAAPAIDVESLHAKIGELDAGRTSPKLDFGQFERCARARPVQAKRTGRGISLRSRLSRDRKEIDATHISRLKPLKNRFKIDQSQAKKQRHQLSAPKAGEQIRMPWHADANSRPPACGILSRRTTSQGQRTPSRDVQRCRTGTAILRAVAVIAFADARREPPVECAQCRVGPSDGYGSKSQKRRGPAPRPRRPVRETSCRPCASSRPAAGRALKGRSGSRRSSLPCPAPRAVPPEPCAPPRSAASCSSPPRVHRWRRRSARVTIARAGHVTIASARVPRPPGLAAAAARTATPFDSAALQTASASRPASRTRSCRKGLEPPPLLIVTVDCGGCSGYRDRSRSRDRTLRPKWIAARSDALHAIGPAVVFERSCPSIACGLGVTPAQNSPRRCDLRPKPTIRSDICWAGQWDRLFIGGRNEKALYAVNRRAGDGWTVERRPSGPICR